MCPGLGTIREQMAPDADDLAGLDLNPVYRSCTSRLGYHLLQGLLRVGVTYDRAVAFVSSSVLGVAAAEFAHFFERGNVMRLVCCPRLSRQDAHALRRSVTERPTVLRDRRSASDLLRAGDLSHALSVLVARGCVQLRIAVRSPDAEGAIYHEKIGLVCDARGNSVAMSGSANESSSAWRANFERVDLYASWRDPAERARTSRIRDQFDALWRNETPGVTVMDLARAVTLGVLSVQENEETLGRSRVSASLTSVEEVLVPPDDMRLYAHQERAIASWGDAGGRGILEMATGSGKTFTALMLAARVHVRLARPMLIVIVAPYIHLVDQWIAACEKFGLRPVRCAEGKSSWHSQLSSSVSALGSGRRTVLSVVTTSSTLVSDGFQEVIRRVAQPILLIADECHNYGSRQMRLALPDHAEMRLGLSATPERWMDEEGTRELTSYFGGVVFSYGLAEAIAGGVLTPYRYFPIRVELEDDELDEYMEITRLLCRYLGGSHDDALNESAKRLLLRRARLIASARSKIRHLRRLMSPRASDTHMLVYCGDGQVEGAVPQESVRQVEAAVRMIGVDLGMTCASYTHQTPPARRLELLRLFGSGDLQALVAIRCLDEGVDVPATRTAYILASSTNPRQFVQRRGRVLRRYPGKRRAEIYDFFAVPPLEGIDAGTSEYAVLRRLLGGQIQRAAEFADLAENGPQARSELLDLTTFFALHGAWERKQP